MIVVVLIVIAIIILLFVFRGVLIYSNEYVPPTAVVLAPNTQTWEYKGRVEPPSEIYN